MRKIARELRLELTLPFTARSQRDLHDASRACGNEHAGSVGNVSGGSGGVLDQLRSMQNERPAEPAAPSGPQVPQSR